RDIGHTSQTGGDIICIHFRNVMFDYAEKENTIAKALEDLKANFYCELCDKQYYKHQEFDNHINSYDHAHKQRLKELKQREFARNVASKSRKDERKQEKALQRLHKLAELRKETVCAPGSGPMFKSTTVTVRENFHEISRREVVDTVNNQHDFKYTLIHSEENAKDVSTVPVDAEGTEQCTTNNHQLGEKAQGIHKHKVGFSFAFPKKTCLKLESSAAAFSEHSDDSTAGKEFSRKSRFVPSSCHLQLSSPTDLVLNSEEKANSLHPPEAMMCMDEETAQIQEMKEVSIEKDTSLHSFCQLQLPLSSIAGNCQDSVPLVDQVSLDHVTNEDIPVSSACSDVLGSLPTVLNMPTDHIPVKATTEENVKEDTSKIETENKNSVELQNPSKTEEDNVTVHKKTDLCKRQAEPFVPVLNKLGSTVLQWPSEMLVYTVTEPSISYSCNPLCFDFKSTKLNSDKNKLFLNEHHSQQKEDFSKTPVSESKDTLIPVLTDCEISGSRNGHTQVPAHLSIDTLPNSCEMGHNESMGQRYKNISCRTIKVEKCNFTKSQTKDFTLNEKNNKTKRDTHEHWFHKCRRKKKRRKLRLHPHRVKTKESENDCKMDIGRHCPYISRKDLLEPIAERQYLATEKLLASHPKSVSMDISENEEESQTSNTEFSDKDASPSKQHCRRNTGLVNGQSNPTVVHSAKHNFTYSRTYCCWKARLSTCSQDQRNLLLQSDAKCTSQNLPVKRGYNSLMNESERSHRKRRQHSCSYSSDESLNQQTYLPEDVFRPPNTSLAPCKPKRKRRRKRSRLPDKGGTLEIKESLDNPMRCSSSLSHLDRSVSEDTKEEIKLQEDANIEGNPEQTDSIENKLAFPTGDPLPSETSGEAVHSVMETMPGDKSQVPNDCTPSVDVAQAPAEGMTDNALHECNQRRQTTNIHERQIPFKVPHIERNFRQSQPKSYICHYELAETIPQGKVNETSAEWLCYNSGILNAQPPIPFKEAHVSSHAFVTTEQILAPLAFPEQALLIPLENHDKFKTLPCEVYQHIPQPNMLTNKVKFTFPAAPHPPPSTAVQPLPLQQPLSSTSVTTIHHAVLQQHAAAAAAGTFKVLQPHQQFLSQVPALSRTSIPQISVGPVGPIGPRLCPGSQPTFVASPQMQLIPASVLHPGHLSFPPLPHALFPSLLSPHPTVIPLQPLF
uniref:Zinc finger protein 804A n=1 Tax=Jaculus jaculus TaxID=51337 RepID=A0A8C5JZ60_JACJA